MSYDIKGQLLLTEATQEVTATFKKREFVIEVANERNSAYNDFIKFQLTQDRCAIIDAFKPGQMLKVSFDIRGRKWEKDGRTSYFTSLEAWRIEGIDTPAASNEPLPQYQETQIPPAEEGDDLPF
ncbi:uncharacterized protein DUF3127 [Breznakibacter xylanolyticus]|uniref:Uncharacterized protein DUF3127 n=1 Tax=Breznakibacter xylanolyticus TaxID=990 RepID=A0A2W7MUR6_9BACT|nr:DUF3127 domain-containing protein [Breznakibacter xylanolyticus]PZX11283.1 uncharacterized protein DUF3127 [Breznakibacter xylanolyticus]